MNALGREWLIADGLGGYAMGTPNGLRTRRYHGLLLVAAPDSERRFMLVNGVEAWIDTGGRSVPLSSHRYHPDTLHPVGPARMTKSSMHPWPSWTYEWPAGQVEHSITGVHGKAATILRWHWGGKEPAKLRVRLHMSGRDWHSLHRENAGFRFASEAVGEWGRRFAPYNGVSPVIAFANGKHRDAPMWFRNFQYDEESARGLDCLEDLASPGEFVFELSAKQPEAVIVLTIAAKWGGLEIAGEVREAATALRDVEKRRLEAFPSAAHRLADQFIIARGKRRTIIAGYPWFTDWGRDTFIALRGLCLGTGRRADAESILLSWCEHLSEGMMPNLFPSGAGAPEYNSVDASLWFIIAVHDLTATDGAVPNVPLPFIKAVDDILSHYARGTRFAIRMDADGLLAAGEPGKALTWMDAIVDGAPVTPRIGKPVEVQALWINALEFASKWNARWATVAARARESFAKKFWNEKRKCLYDVVDVDHVAGKVDDRLRPNQIFACGGLPNRIVSDEMAVGIVRACSRELHSGMALRSLGPKELGYIGRADGPIRQRDLAYHQGTAWLWLNAAFWDAVFRDKGGHPLLPPVEPLELEGLEAPGEPMPERLMAGEDEERERTDPSDQPLSESWPLTLMADFPDFSGPFDPFAMLESQGLIAWEIADGDKSTRMRGCPFQAWSVGEHIRHKAMMESARAAVPPRAPR